MSCTTSKRKKVFILKINLRQITSFFPGRKWKLNWLHKYSVNLWLMLLNFVVKLPQFQGCKTTVVYLHHINYLFDILNSRNCHQFGYSKALANITQMEHYKSYNKLKSTYQVWKPAVIQALFSNRIAGFLGFIICIKNVIQLYESLVMTQNLMYLPMHKMSQDHVELFFQMIRSQGVHNNNRIIRKFKSAYRKVMVSTELKNVNNGNCSAEKSSLY